MGKRGTFWAILVLASGLAQAASVEWTNAYDLYQRTEYEKSLTVLQSIQERDRDPDVLLLIGRNFYMMAEFKKATEVLEKAVLLKADDAETYLWLGRAWGRRAETANFLTAPGYATKARQFFEKSLALDPKNRDTIGDLFDFYMEAPGFLGGGKDKAEALAARVAKMDAAEGHYYQAQIDARRNALDSAEKHLRQAVELAPYQPGRLLDLAKFLATRGRTKESDAFFEKAAKIDPANPGLLFERAEILIKTNRNTDEARRLLQQYLKSPLKPTDPSRREAEALLKKIGA
ncbi:MAG: tetratricopeptide repeat protein [Bryobacteraceae bacterium]